MDDFSQTLDHRCFDSHRYAVVDAVWRDDLPSDWPLTVMAPAFLGTDTDRCPVLLDLRALPLDERGELMERLQQQVADREDALCSLLLEADCEPQAMADHLGQRMALKVAGASQPQQFRFFDPGTFLQLPRLLGPAGMAWLLGPAHAALVPWAGGWTRYPLPYSKAHGFSLTAVHLAALTRMGVVNRVALQMEPPEDAAEWTARCAALDAHVQRAMDAHGLRLQADLVAFAQDAVTHHPAFDSHPQVAGWLQALRTATPEDELDYRELRSRITLDEWQKVAADLQSTASTRSPQGHPKEGNRT